MPTDLRFAFGENWASFSKSLNEEQLTEARESLRQLLGVENLAGKSFLDIGCGSGLFSIAAAQLGSERVVGVDVDPISVQVSKENARRWMPDASIDFRQASVLDEAAMESLGVFDVVYSWGVLHHTGNMHKALKIASERVRPGGVFAIAIYNRHWSSPVWKVIKRIYNLIPAWAQQGMVWGFAPFIALAKAVVTRRNPLNVRRGMDFYHNLVDWLGGYPYEYATVEQMRAIFIRVSRVSSRASDTGPCAYRV